MTTSQRITISPVSDPPPRDRDGAPLRWQVIDIDGKDDEPEVNCPLCDVAIVIDDLIAADNPRFDRERFLKACGQETEG